MALLEEEGLSRQLIICGMHRSGTSLVASALQRAGLDIGRDVSTPGPGNLRGHFEDPDFHRLHEDMLAAAGETCFTVDHDFAPPQQAEFERRARALAEEREEHPLWGWKDPRTCLFLDFWDPILPQAHYLFLYRHPVDVALSLWRRNTDPELRQTPWLAVRAWEIYNRRLLELRARHPERTFLAQVPALTASLGSLVRGLRRSFGLPLHDGCADAVFAPEELTPPSPPDPVWETLIPGALALYRRLDANADVPAREVERPQPSRDDAHLSASASLLYALLETDGRARAAPAGDGHPPLRELEEALLHERQRAAEAVAHEEQSRLELQAELAAERQRTAQLAESLRDERVRTARAESRIEALAKVLTEIEGSRSFAPIRAWWRLRRRLGRGV